MTSSSNYQLVLMPVAQRGAQDDCQKFTVGGGAGNGNDGNEKAKTGRVVESSTLEATVGAKDSRANKKARTYIS